MLADVIMVLCVTINCSLFYECAMAYGAEMWRLHWADPPSQPHYGGSPNKTICPELSVMLNFQ